MNSHYHQTVNKHNPKRGIHQMIKTAFNGQMDLADIRRKNLRDVVDTAFGGNVSELARRAGGRKPSFFNDLFAERKSFGEKLARNLEDALDLEPMSLDQAKLVSTQPGKRIAESQDICENELFSNRTLRIARLLDGPDRGASRTDAQFKAIEQVIATFDQLRKEIPSFERVASTSDFAPNPPATPNAEKPVSSSTGK
ncbi:hypothetical protein [Chitiniphilus eburneus]|uniref:hypothetical protein n=1 Tax=Chitiniphilus eburneus TaxID=2571148 RepID=UPI0035CF5B2E